MIEVAIDQGKTVKELLQAIRDMRGINLIGELSLAGPESVLKDEEEIELTKTLMYSYKDAKKQAIQVMFEENYTLEDLGVMDRQALIVTEVLTDRAKTII